MLVLGLALLLAPAYAAAGQAAPVPLVAPGTPAADNTGTSTITYTVQAGDTLAGVARRYRVRPERLAQANDLPGADARLMAGQVLRVPQPVPSEGQRLPAPARVQLNHLGTRKVVLADYMAWYSHSTFDGRQTFDLPAAGPYSSSDPATIERHLAEAQRACLDGLAVHWYGPFDPVTTGNFEKLLRASAGTELRHSVVLLTNMWPGADEALLTEAIHYVIEHWAYGPNYMRLGERPLLLFSDMPRPWGSDAAALAGWTRIREATDPEHRLVWMAEGLSTLYNPLFDGLYVYRIDHRDYPRAWLKQPRFASALRAVEAQGANPIGGLYFADTIAPGYDDTRAVNVPMDLRAPAPAFARDREDGVYYTATFAVTEQTGGDFLLVKSFNEWVEGTAIEPSVTYGERYLDLTCHMAQAYRGE